MSEYRRPEFALQLQQRGGKVARAEVFSARDWWGRPGFRDLYPQALFAGLYRLRLAGTWWWATQGGAHLRYPFLAIDEAWHVVSCFASNVVGLPSPMFALPAPEWVQPKAPVSAMVDGLLCSTHVLDWPWRGSDGLWRVRIVAVPFPVPVNTLASA